MATVKKGKAKTKQFNPTFKQIPILYLLPHFMFCRHHDHAMLHSKNVKRRFFNRFGRENLRASSYYLGEIGVAIPKVVVQAEGWHFNAIVKYW